MKITYDNGFLSLAFYAYLKSKRYPGIQYDNGLAKQSSDPAPQPANNWLKDFLMFGEDSGGYEAIMVHTTVGNSWNDMYMEYFDKIRQIVTQETKYSGLVFGRVNWMKDSYTIGGNASSTAATEAIPTDLIDTNTLPEDPSDVAQIDRYSMGNFCTTLSPNLHDLTETHQQQLLSLAREYLPKLYALSPFLTVFFTSAFANEDYAREDMVVPLHPEAHNTNVNYVFDEWPTSLFKMMVDAAGMLREDMSISEYYAEDDTMQYVIDFFRPNGTNVDNWLYDNVGLEGTADMLNQIADYLLKAMYGDIESYIDYHHPTNAPWLYYNAGSIIPVVLADSDWGTIAFEYAQALADVIRTYEEGWTDAYVKLTAERSMRNYAMYCGPSYAIDDNSGAHSSQDIGDFSGKLSSCIYSQFSPRVYNNQECGNALMDVVREYFPRLYAAGPFVTCWAFRLLCAQELKYAEDIAVYNPDAFHWSPDTASDAQYLTLRDFYVVAYIASEVGVEEYFKNGCDEELEQAAEDAASDWTLDGILIKKLGYEGVMEILDEIAEYLMDNVWGGVDRFIELEPMSD